MKFGFIGPTYTGRSRIADVQRCVNLYPETVESARGKNVVALHGSPGLRLFATLTDGPVRALFRSDENGERLLAVGRGVLYDVTLAGGVTSLGNIQDALTPVTIAYNRTQYMIVSGGHGYILTGNTLVEITDPDFPGAEMVTYLDGYFVILKTGTQEIWISGLYDGTTWNALDYAPAEAAPDDLKSIFADHGELWLFGSEKTEVFYNSGNLDFPFERISGAIIEHGIDAPYSTARLAGGIFGLSKNKQGSGMVIRSQGFQSQRVSNHAVEFAIQNYSRTDDALGYGYQEEGHEFYVLSFPTAEATWVYDNTSGMWHERGYWQPVQGFTMQRGRCYAYAFGKHLVGDRSSGQIYEQSLDVYSDNGDAIRRLRRAPHVNDEHRWLFHRELALDMEVGVGLQTGQGSDPKLMMRFSDDGGFNWSNVLEKSIGKVGERREQVIFRRLGRSQDRVYEVVISDPVKVAFVDAYLEVSR